MKAIQPQWGRLRSLNKNINNTRRRLVNSIMKKVSPLMWKSGFVKGSTGNKKDKDGDYIMLKIIFFDKEDGYKISGTDLVFSGFTEENSVIVDAYGGGLSTQNLLDLPIETLIKLWSWVEIDRYKKLTKKKINDTRCLEHI